MANSIFLPSDARNSTVPFWKLVNSASIFVPMSEVHVRDDASVGMTKMLRRISVRIFISSFADRRDGATALAVAPIDWFSNRFLLEANYYW